MISSKYQELLKINSRLKEIELEKYTLEFEIKKFESYYNQKTKWENWEIDCFITNIALDYDLLSIEENELLNKAMELDKNMEQFEELIKMKYKF